MACYLGISARSGKAASLCLKGWNMLSGIFIIVLFFARSLANHMSFVGRLSDAFWWWQFNRPTYSQHAMSNNFGKRIRSMPSVFQQYSTRLSVTLIAQTRHQNQLENSEKCTVKVQRKSLSWFRTRLGKPISTVHIPHLIANYWGVITHNRITGLWL